MEDLDDISTPTLAIDYVALRDIRAGEELFLYYGKVWEQAWRRHQSLRTIDSRSPYYQNAHKWNKKYATAPIRTEDEQSADPYPGHIEVRCHHDILAPNPSSNEFTWETNDYGFPCSIIDRFIEDSEILYTVDVELWPETGYDNKRPEVEEVIRVLRTDIPRPALRFFDVTATSDLHLEKSFRHWIDLPDEMMPEQWRNVKLDDEDE